MQLKSKDARRRRRAVERLAQPGDPRGVAALVRATHDSDQDLRFAAYDGLVKIGPAAIPALHDLLAKADPVDRAVAVSVLGELGDPAGCLPVLAMVSDASALVRAATAEALGQLADRRAGKALLALLGDDDADVRRCAAKALGRLGDVRSVPALLGRLRDPERTVQVAAARAMQTEAWAALPSPRRVLVLLTIQQWVMGFRDEELEWDKDLADILAQLLRDLEALLQRGTRMTEELVGLLGEPSALIRAWAAGALQQVGDSGAVLPLLRAVGDADERVRQAAMDALMKIGPGTFRAVLAALRDGDSGVRRSAADLLGRLRNPQAVEPLHALLSDPEYPVRKAALTALQQIGGGQIPPLPRDDQDQMKLLALWARRRARAEQKAQSARPASSQLELQGPPFARPQNSAERLISDFLARR